MLIFFIGFMASGKSTPCAMSRKLGVPVVDLDELIAEVEGMAVREIFEQKVWGRLF
ncbi:MAG: shikimate kinase [Bacteroidia bacterium]